MTMQAQEIVNAIGAGVADALNTNRLFLGVEEDAFNNADIHPEYVTTVAVAKTLTAPDRYVSLETHMKELRKHAHGLARMKQKFSKTSTLDIDGIVARYKFGKRDSQRLDIVVRSSDPLQPPLLIAEAKLGVENLAGVIQDIERVVRLLTMYDDLHLLSPHHIYGAVLFHSMEMGNAAGTASQKARDLISAVSKHLQSLMQAKSWLNAKCGLLTQSAKVQAVTGYREVQEDGSFEDVFAKDSFTFAPGLVLLGNAGDVSTVAF